MKPSLANTACWIAMALCFASHLGHASLLLDGDFESLPIGNAPDATVPAGNWQFPADYVDAGIAEISASEFTIVAAPGSGTNGNALQVFGTASDAADHHLPNILLEPVTRSAGEVLIVTFDLFVHEFFGGGCVYIGSGGASSSTQRGPQLIWNSSGQLLATEGTTLTVLDDYPRNEWQQVRLEVDLAQATYKVSIRLAQPGSEEPITIIEAENLQFRSGPLPFIDRFTIARFSFDPNVRSVIDNIEVLTGHPPIIAKQPGVEYVLPGDPQCTNLFVVAEGAPPWNINGLRMTISLALQMYFGVRFPRIWTHVGPSAISFL